MSGWGSGLKVESLALVVAGSLRRVEGARRWDHGVVHGANPHDRFIKDHGVVPHDGIMGLCVIFYQEARQRQGLPKS